jgi:hypothetical protein
MSSALAVAKHPIIRKAINLRIVGEALPGALAN